MGGQQSAREPVDHRNAQLRGVNPFTGGELLYFPPGDFYPAYAADPSRVGFGFQTIHVSRVDIEDTSNSRVNLRAGISLGIVRSVSRGEPHLGWQLSVMGGFNDQNDVRQSLDNIGWDGHYGLLLTGASLRSFAWKFGILHVSSHVGDELMERTGRLRIGYTREEIALGISWFPRKRLRLYTEGGRAYTLRNRELQKPLRFQSGMEYESAPNFFRGVASWYGAADLQSMEERGWRFDLALQTGFAVHSAGRTWRFGIEWYDGRPPIGEFFQNTEQYLSMGIWIDL